MHSHNNTKLSLIQRQPPFALRFRLGILASTSVATSLLLLTGLSRTARAGNTESSEETTTVIVVVKESDTGAPVSQAAITLQFTEPGTPSRFGKSKKRAYTAKTDAQGRCRLQEINKGPIVLMVTATGHQSYGKELQLEKDNQVFEVKLKRPQPLL